MSASGVIDCLCAMAFVEVDQPPISIPRIISSTAPINRPTGMNLAMPARNEAKSTSSIITTNRNSTATAPT